MIQCSGSQLLLQGPQMLSLKYLTFYKIYAYPAMVAKQFRAYDSLNQIKLGTSFWSPSKVNIMAGAESLNEMAVPHILKLESEAQDGG